MKPRAARTFHISIIAGKLDELEQYHQRIEEFIAEEVASLRSRLGELLGKLTEEERYQRQTFYSDEYSLLGEVFTRTLRVSVLFIGYMLFETSLEAICAAEQKHRGHSRVLRDMKGEGIERAKLYLVKVCGVAFPGESREWVRLTDFNKVRNALSHADGDITRVRNPDHVRQVIGRTPGLCLRGGTHLEVGREYVASIIRDIRCFFDLLHKAFRD